MAAVANRENLLKSPTVGISRPVKQQWMKLVNQDLEKELPQITFI